jgi:hypothetical protein
VEPNVPRGWSEPHLRLSGLLALLIRNDLCRHAVRRLSFLRDVLQSRLLLELSEHLRHLMVTEPDTDLERCLSATRPSSDVRS